jgi:biopolymer transport protein ExbB
MAEVYNTIVDFFQEGGLFLVPISLVLAIGLAIAFERWVFLNREKWRNRRAFDEFLPLLRTTDMEKMQMYSRENQAPVTRIIACGLDMMKVSKQRADVENSMSEGMLETMPRLERRTGYLSVLANVATLLGLLGTIIGLIGAFRAVASVDPAQKSEMLSSSISVAMNTTAFGLMAAIPLLVLHALLQNKTTAIVSGIQMSAVKFLNMMTLHRFIEAGAPRPNTPEPASNEG